jgi:flavodoxin
MKSLVVYYTRTGNSKFVAQTVAAELGSDIEEVVDKKKRSGPLRWVLAGKDATQKSETQIEPTKLFPKDYDLIVLGQPIWAWSPTPAIRTYIKQNDLSGKSIALFFTMDNAPKQAVEKTKALMSNSKFVGELILTKPLKTEEETKRKISEWCNTLKTLNDA